MTFYSFFNILFFMRQKDIRQTSLRLGDRVGTVIPFPPLIDRNGKSQLSLPLIENQDILNDSLLKESMRGNVKKIRDLVQRGSDVDTTDHYGRTPLMNAASKGLRKTVDALVELNADIHIRDNYNMNALMHAIAGNHTCTASALWGYGAR